jgi:hypothetical protein
MSTVYFMYELVSAVRAKGTETEIIHKRSGQHDPMERHIAPQSYEALRTVFMRDCVVLSAQQYIADRFIMNDRSIFLEFQSMDGVHQGETVMLNLSDIMSYGGSSNDSGVYITTFTGMMFVMPVELKAFAHAHEAHRKQGRGTPTFGTPDSKAA